jgi:phosphoribosyl 1,2-cyclic phosphate phosphodiesterase
MRVEILGSGGATTTPRPGCACAVCAEARERGVPYARTGPSVFVHGPDAVFDTPEEAKLQLDRAELPEIAACFYSHWHPDHTMGRRVWETRNADFRGWPREAKRNLTTDVYLPQQVAADHREYLGGWKHLAFMEERGWIRLHELADGDVVRSGTSPCGRSGSRAATCTPSSSWRATGASCSRWTSSSAGARPRSSAAATSR